MKIPNKEYIENIRNKAYRPEVVVAFIYNKLILFVYKKEHNLWQLAQGGIKLNENLRQAVEREMLEELDPNLLQGLKEMYFIMEDKIDFPKKLHNSRHLYNSNEQKLEMKGKYYFVIAVLTNNDRIDLRKTDFDNAKWLSYTEAMHLTKTIYQKRKRFLTRKILNKLRKLNLL